MCSVCDLSPLHFCFRVHKLNIVSVMRTVIFIHLTLIYFPTLVHSHHPELNLFFFPSPPPRFSVPQLLTTGVRKCEMQHAIRCNTHPVGILIDQWSLHRRLVSLRTEGVGAGAAPACDALETGKGIKEKISARPFLREINSRQDGVDRRHSVQLLCMVTHCQLTKFRPDYN